MIKNNPHPGDKEKRGLMINYFWFYALHILAELVSAARIRSLNKALSV
jgi:hypothetical protein